MKAENTLIIFTRYPEAGKTKTRLMPAIGAEKAAEIQKQMTENTIAKAVKLKSKLEVYIEIYFNGGNLTLMENWLGTQHHYQPQGEGDLGRKMFSAIGDCFAQGGQKVVIIGIDCPSLSAEILTEAFVNLDSHPMVIGGASDGGYYLLGLSQLNESLFVNIDWGSDRVFAQTINST